MLRYLGYVAISLSVDATTNRNCRLRNATPQLLRKLIKENLQGLYRILEFNAQNQIYLYRISSQIIPFASHPVNTVPWWDEFADLFAGIAEFIARHQFRVSMHPGRFTVLNSPNPEIVNSAIRELEWHVRFLDCLHTDDSNKIILHLGGVYANKVQAMERFVATVDALPNSWHNRLVLENDERLYNVEDVLSVAQNTGLPVVIDWLHHTANHSPAMGNNPSEPIRRCFGTWHTRDGLPKIHYSDQAPGGRPGNHADWVNADGFVDFLRLVPEQDFDCMLEAKQKDLALFRLRHELRARGIVKSKAA